MAPHRPGVFWMLDEKGHVLFVGGARSLRLKLLSYKYQRKNVRQRLGRLMAEARRTEWTLCASESLAYHLEAELVRRFRPPYNTLSPRDEEWTYVGYHFTPRAIQFAIGSRLERLDEVNAYGAFRGPWLTRQAYGAIVRLLLLAIHRDPQLMLPADLRGPHAPDKYRIPLPRSFSATSLQKWNELLDGYFSGRSRDLVRAFYQVEDFAVERGVVPSLRAWIRQDLDLLNRFYLQGPRAHERLRNRFALSERLLPATLQEDFLLKRS